MTLQPSPKANVSTICEMMDALGWHRASRIRAGRNTLPPLKQEKSSHSRHMRESSRALRSGTHHEAQNAGSHAPASARTRRPSVAKAASTLPTRRERADCESRDPPSGRRKGRSYRRRAAPDPLHGNHANAQCSLCPRDPVGPARSHARPSGQTAPTDDPALHCLPYDPGVRPGQPKVARKARTGEGGERVGSRQSRSVVHSALSKSPSWTVACACRRPNVSSIVVVPLFRMAFRACLCLEIRR
jgi:hypothetical protein